MKKYIFIIYFAGLLVCNIFAENPPEEKWVARYNGPGNYHDGISAIVLDCSGNIYVTGGSNNGSTSSDYTTIKYDSNGTQKWMAFYNGTGNKGDSAYEIALDGLGNVYVTGNSPGSSTNVDYATVKYDSNGTQKWVSRYNGQGDDLAYAMALDNCDNVYVTGQSLGIDGYTDFATIKYDTNGTQKWEDRYRGPGHDYLNKATAIAVDSSGNVYVTGNSNGRSISDDYITIKYDTNGTQLWVARYSGPGNFSDLATAIALDNYGNVYVTGQSYGIGTNVDYATIKYDSNGTQLWVARYSGPGNFSDLATAIALDNYGNVYVTGQSYGIGTNVDYATIKYDTNGTQLWVARYNGPGNASDNASAIALDVLNNVYVTGQSYGIGTDVDYATIKYDSNGTQLWAIRYNGTGNSSDRAYDIALDRGCNVYVSGGSYGSGTGLDCVTIKYVQHDYYCGNNNKGDFNNDGIVDFRDFAILSDLWLDNDCGYPYWCNCADIDKDFVVGLKDLDYFSERWLENYIYELTTSVIGGHGTISPDSNSFYLNTVVTLTAVPDPNYGVKAWIGTDNDSCTTTINAVTMSDAKNVTVQFAILYDLNASVIGGHGTITTEPALSSYIDGTVVTLNAFHDAGYAVKVWHGTDDDNSTSTTNTVTMNSAKSVTVEFIVLHNLSAEVIGGHGTIQPTYGNYKAGTVVTLTATPDVGYFVKAWSGTDNDSLKTLANTVTMNSGKYVTVEFEDMLPNGGFEMGDLTYWTVSATNPPNSYVEVWEYTLTEGNYCVELCVWNEPPASLSRTVELPAGIGCVFSFDYECYNQGGHSYVKINGSDYELTAGGVNHFSMPLSSSFTVEFHQDGNGYLDIDNCTLQQQ